MQSEHINRRTLTGSRHPADTDTNGVSRIRQTFLYYLLSYGLMFRFYTFHQRHSPAQYRNITLNNTLYVLCYGKLTFFGLPLQIRIDGRRLLNACIDNQAFIFSAIFRMFHDKTYGLIISL